MSKVKFDTITKAYNYLKKNYRLIHYKTFMEDKYFILTNKLWDPNNYAVIQVDIIKKSNYDNYTVYFTPCVIDVFMINVDYYQNLFPQDESYNDVLEINNDFTRGLINITNKIDLKVWNDPDDLFTPYINYLDNYIVDNYQTTKIKMDEYKKAFTTLKIKLLTFMKTLFPKQDYTLLGPSNVSQIDLVFEKYFSRKGVEATIAVYLHEGDKNPVYNLFIGDKQYHNTNLKKFIKTVHDKLGN